MQNQWTNFSLEWKVIIKSKFAEWNHGKKYWYFYDGIKSIINPDGSYSQGIKFDKIPLDLSNISSQFQLDRERLDDREMNILQIYQRLLVAKKAGDIPNLIKLQVNFQKRFTLPSSCAVLAFLGAAIGINLQPRIKYNSLTITLVIATRSKNKILWVKREWLKRYRTWDEWFKF